MTRNLYPHTYSLLNHFDCKQTDITVIYPDETSESDETVSEEIAEVVGSYGKEIISKLMRKKNLACEKRERREEKAEEAMEKKGKTH